MDGEQPLGDSRTSQRRVSERSIGRSGRLGDEKQYRLILEPEPYGIVGLPLDALVAFYGRCGYHWDSYWEMLARNPK